jgi:hypothetical protein
VNQVRDIYLLHPFCNDDLSAFGSSMVVLAPTVAVMAAVDQSSVTDVNSQLPYIFLSEMLPTWNFCCHELTSNTLLISHSQDDRVLTYLAHRVHACDVPDKYESLKSEFSSRVRSHHI